MGLGETQGHSTIYIYIYNSPFHLHIFSHLFAHTYRSLASVITLSMRSERKWSSRPSCAPERTQTRGKRKDTLAPLEYSTRLSGGSSWGYSQSPSHAFAKRLSPLSLINTHTHTHTHTHTLTLTHSLSHTLSFFLSQSACLCAILFPSYMFLGRQAPCIQLVKGIFYIICFFYFTYLRSLHVIHTYMHTYTYISPANLCTV